jgi:tetratricopeptide (TPR) repeat protein
MGTENKEILLNEFVSRYFTKGEAEEFNTKFLQQLDYGQLPSNLLSSGTDQFNLDLFNSYYLNVQIDQLVTFAERRFKADRYLSFLLYIGEFAVTKGEMDIALSIYNRILEKTASESKFSDITANANLSIAEIYSRQAEWKDSLKFVKKAYSLFDLMRNPKGKAKCENLFGTIYGDMGNINKAKEHFQKSFAILKNSKDLSLLGMVEINLGIINLMQEDFEGALLYLKRSLTNFQQTGDLKRISEIHYNTGMAHLKMNDYDCALSEFDAAINTAGEFGYLPVIVLAFLSKAQVYLKLDDHNLAAAFADRSLELAYRINDRLTVADVYKLKGVIQKNMNNYTAAENYFLTSLRINKELSNKYNYAETSFELGLLYKETGKKKESSNHLNEAKTYYRRIKAESEIKKIELIMN